MTRAFLGSQRAVYLTAKPSSHILCTRTLSRTNHGLLKPSVVGISARAYSVKQSPRGRGVTASTTSSSTEETPSKETPPDSDITGDGINPSLSTLPPPLSLPTRDPDSSAIAYWFRVGRAYGRFYTTGVKQTYRNYKKAKQLRARISRSKALNISQGHNAKDYPRRRFLRLFPPPMLVDIETFMRKESLARSEPQLLRSEFQLLAREREDVKKLPLFALLVAVFGEWLPFLVPFIPGRVPRTCRIPKQVSGMRIALEEGRKESFRKGVWPPGESVPDDIRARLDKVQEIESKVGYMQWRVKALPKEMKATNSMAKTKEEEENFKQEQLKFEATEDEIDDVAALRWQPSNWLAVAMTEAMDRRQLVHVSAVLGLHGKIWNILGYSPLGELLKARVAKRLHYLSLDDELLVQSRQVRSDALRTLSETELGIACEERGIDVSNRPPESLRKDLKKWLDGRLEDTGCGEPLFKMLFTR